MQTIAGMTEDNTNATFHLPVGSILFPSDAFHRTRLNGLLDTIRRTAIRQDDLGFLFLFVKGKHFLADLHAGFTTDTFFFIDDNNFGHGAPLFLISTRRQRRHPIVNHFASV
jgi:hypothetical protein